MSDHPTPRSRSALVYHAGMVGLVLALGTLWYWQPVYARLDFWNHAAVGRWVYEAGRVPDRTLYLWSADHPHVYHSWLSGVVFYGLASVGDRGQASTILAFTAALALAPFAVAWLVWARTARLPSWAYVPLVIGIEGIAPRVEPRPELFTGLFLALLLAALVAWSRSAGPPTLRRAIATAAAAAVVFSLWANLHGAVVLGVLFLGVSAVCDLAQDRFNPRARALVAVAALAPLGAVCNPYGLGYWRAFRPVVSTEYTRTITEWVPLWEDPPLPPEMWVAAVGLVGAALAGWALTPGRRWAHLGWLGFGVGLFVLARRNIWPLAIVALVVLAANSRPLDPVAVWAWLGRRSRPGAKPLAPPGALRWILRTALAAWLLLQLWVAADDVRPWRPFGPSRIEGGIVRFVQDARPPGRVFNDYENSSYLQWRFAGDPALFIDRLNAYPDALMRDYWRVVRDPEWRAELDRHGVGVVILTTDRGSSFSLAPFADRLDADPDWMRVYAGADGVVWVRKTAESEAVWRPRVGKVKDVAFGTLERWGRENDVLTPVTIPEKWR